MKFIKYISLGLMLCFAMQGCASHKSEIVISGLVGAAAGAGLGYGVVHHGKNNQYEVQNTIITSSVVALLTMGVMAWHYNQLDEQKVEIMSHLTSEWIKSPENQNKVMQLGDPSLSNPNFVGATPENTGASAIKLDENTRWVYPTFRKRDLQAETGQDQITSARYVWEIVRPGFFVNRGVQPWYFEDSSTKESGPSKKNDPSHEGISK